jgi:large subunit ribosomal protein L19
MLNRFRTGPILGGPMADVLQQVETARLRDDLPDFDPGDTVRVLYRVREGDKERIQAFEGICIGRRGGGNGATFTVRKISSGIGVERVFPDQAPTVKGVEVVRRGRVRRAKLYYLRNLKGKAARISEQRSI